MLFRSLQAVGVQEVKAVVLQAAVVQEVKVVVLQAVQVIAPNDLVDQNRRSISRAVQFATNYFLNPSGTANPCRMYFRKK